MVMLTLLMIAIGFGLVVALALIIALIWYLIVKLFVKKPNANATNMIHMDSIDEQ